MTSDSKSAGHRRCGLPSVAAEAVLEDDGDAGPASVVEAERDAVLDEAPVDSYRMIRPDACVLGVSGVHLKAGITVFDAEEAAVKRAMLEHAARVFGVAASEKLGTVSPYCLAPAGRITHLITDCGASPDFVQSLEELGVEVVAV